MSNSTGKPAKPRPDFPLFPHATKRWAKKIRGKMHYFGPWDDPQGALEKYLEQKEDLHAGRLPRVSNGQADTLTVGLLADKFLNSRRLLRESGELAPRTWDDYYKTCEALCSAFGRQRPVDDLRPEDFETLRGKWARTWGPVRLRTEIKRVRIVFNYGYKQGHLERPMLYGDGFRPPSQKTLRKARAEKGPRMFQAEELRRIIKAASQPMRAMILLGINCGFGNADVGRLPLEAIDLKGGWIDFARPKTGVDRRVPLWPETVKAIRAWLKERPQVDGPLFLRRDGSTWASDTTKNPVTIAMTTLLQRLEINGHRNFYALRHTFQTVGDESGDFLAVRAIMGHTGGNDIADAYRERISDERLQRAAEHVRRWLALQA